MYAPIGILLNHLEELKGLKHLTSHVLGSYTVMGRANAVPLATAIDLGHGANTSTSTEIQVTDSGCCENTSDASKNGKSLRRLNSNIIKKKS